MSTSDSRKGTDSENTRKLVIVESPFRSYDAFCYADNITYAMSCVKDSLLRGESPFASHLLYTQGGILDDMNASLPWFDDIVDQFGKHNIFGQIKSEMRTER